jgi:ribosomal protein S18 acetylase RimI-like enzyme
VVIDIRPRSAADSPGIARVRRESWLAAYTGIIDGAIIDRVTKADGNAADAPPSRRTLVAVGGEDPAVIGYAIFGPERTVVSAVSPPVAPAGGSPAITGGTGELYALYVTPEWWSAGVGRALMDSVLAALREAGYASAVLWVLADNARARRFYDRAGFAPDGATNILAGLGGVLEFRYARDL